jgi:hypothetical protein
MRLSPSTFGLALAAAAASSSAQVQPRAGAEPPPFQAGWPLACRPGVDCWVQNYFDHDPGPGVKDYRCGPMTYDGHDATDIRLATLADMRRGVTVTAAAAGRVRAMRDGMIDLSIKDPANPRVRNQDCGNAAIIDHPGGWTTIYCHMRRGSVRVKAGQQVRAGQAIGQVGLSGDTEFPHLHFGVQRNRADVDVFAPRAGAGQCNAGGPGLWAASVAAKLGYRSPTLIASGFAAGPVDDRAIDAGALAAPTRATPVVAWIRAIGLRAGDVQTLALAGPDGRVLATNAVPPLERAKAQYMAFTGRKAPAGGWAAGAYRATYTVGRGGKAVLQRSWSIILR